MYILVLRLVAKWQLCEQLYCSVQIQLAIYVLDSRDGQENHDVQMYVHKIIVFVLKLAIYDSLSPSHNKSWIFKLKLEWSIACASVVETGLASQHWSGKSEGCT